MSWLQWQAMGYPSKNLLVGVLEGILSFCSQFHGGKN